MAWKKGKDEGPVERKTDDVPPTEEKVVTPPDLTLNVLDLYREPVTELDVTKAQYDWQMRSAAFIQGLQTLKQVQPDGPAGVTMLRLVADSATEMAAAMQQAANLLEVGFRQHGAWLDGE